MSLIIKVNREWIKRQIDSVRESIGRDVTVYTVDRTACTLCLPSGFYNANADSTFYYNCPVCQGSYYIEQLSPHTILARVHWTNDEAISATPGGKYYTGDATITVDPAYKEILEKSEQTNSGKVSVDGHTMFITKIIPMGAPEANRYRAVLKNSGGKPE